VGWLHPQSGRAASGLLPGTSHFCSGLLPFRILSRARGSPLVPPNFFLSRCSPSLSVPTALEETEAIETPFGALPVPITHRPRCRTSHIASKLNSSQPARDAREQLKAPLLAGLLILSSARSQRPGWLPARIALTDLLPQLSSPNRKKAR
jgi:hypothetical protein